MRGCYLVSDSVHSDVTLELKDTLAHAQTLAGSPLVHASSDTLRSLNEDEEYIDRVRQASRSKCWLSMSLLADQVEDEIKSRKNLESSLEEGASRVNVGCAKQRERAAATRLYLAMQAIKPTADEYAKNNVCISITNRKDAFVTPFLDEKTGMFVPDLRAAANAEVAGHMTRMVSAVIADLGCLRSKVSSLQNHVT